MDHHPSIGQGKPLAFCSGGQEERSHTSSLTEADGIDRGLHILHGVVDSQSGCHTASRRIDVEINVFLRIFRFKKEELRNHQVGKHIVDRGSKENDAVFEKA